MLTDPGKLGAQVAALRPRSARPKPSTNIFVDSLRYSTPYREPPDGMARVQLAVPALVPAGRGASGMPPEPLARWRELGGPVCDWAIYVQSVEPPAQVRSQEHRVQQRTGNMQRRVEKKAPSPPSNWWPPGQFGGPRTSPEGP